MIRYFQALYDIFGPLGCIILSVLSFVIVIRFWGLFTRSKDETDENGRKDR
jgi:hypothetical protein